MPLFIYLYTLTPSYPPITIQSSHNRTPDSPSIRLLTCSILPRSLSCPLVAFPPASRTVRALSVPRYWLAPDTLGWVSVGCSLPGLVAFIVVGGEVPAAEVGRGHAFAHYCG